MAKASSKTTIPHRTHIVLTTKVLVAFGLIFASALLFLKLAREVREKETQTLDEGILVWINHHSTSFLDHVMPVATDVGGLIGVVVLTVVGGGLLVKRKDYLRLAFVLISVGGAVGLNLALKSIFMRARPDIWAQLVHETGYSFPSGHTMASAAVAFAFIIALWHSRWRLTAIIVGVIYIGFVGFSRMYLGVHYPSDILAGWLVSGAWVLTVALVLQSSLGRQLLGCSKTAKSNT